MRYKLEMAEVEILYFDSICNKRKNIKINDSVHENANEFLCDQKGGKAPWILILLLIISVTFQFEDFFKCDRYWKDDELTRAKSHVKAAL